MREVKAKREADPTEGMRAWAEAEAREKADIARIAAKASEGDKIEAKVGSRDMSDVAKRKTEEAGARIRFREETKTAKR